MEQLQLEFNTGKCEVMHFGRSQARGEYTDIGKMLNSIEVQRGCGVQVHSSLKVAIQVMPKKTTGMFAFIS